MTFGERLAHLRMKNGLSQESLAEQIQTSVQTLRRWEQGKNVPDVNRLKSLCKVLNVNAEYFLSDTLEESALLPAETVSVEERLELLKAKEKKLDSQKNFMITMGVILGVVCLYVLFSLVVNCFEQITSLWILFETKQRGEDLIMLNGSTFGARLKPLLFLAVVVIMTIRVIKYVQKLNKKD